MATIYADIDIASGRMKLDGSFTDRDDANVVLRGFAERYTTVMTLDVVLNGKTIASAVTFEQKDDDVVAAVNMDTEHVRRMSRAARGPSQVGVSVVLNESDELVAKGRSIVLLNWEEQPGGGGGEVIGAVESVNGKTGVVVLDANDVGAQQVLGTAQSAAVNSGITRELVDKIGVNAVTKVNGMTGDVVVSSDDIMDGAMTVRESIEDIGNLISSHIADEENPHNVTAEQVGARPDDWMPTADEVGARPSDWTPTASDVGARPDNWMPTVKDIGAQAELNDGQLAAVNSGITAAKVAKIDAASAVSSVNGKVGDVVLKAADIGGFYGPSGTDVTVKAKVDSVASEISGHASDTGNPHRTTAEQVGARPEDWMPTAEDVGALTEDDVVPKGSGTYVIATIGGKDIKAPTGGGGGGSVVESETNPGYAANADAAKSVPWSGVAGKPASFNPSVHAATHAANGVDPITPESIGALAKYGGTVDGNLVVNQTFTVGAGALVAQRTGPGRSDVSVTKGGKEVATEEHVSEKVGAAKDELNARIDLIEATAHPNMNIVGSPKFNQGVVGGFSANDYLMFPTQVNVGTNTVNFYMSFTTGADVTTQQNLLDSWCGLAFAIENGRFVLAASSDGTSFVQNQSDAVVNHNTSYNVAINFVNPVQGVYLVRLTDEDALSDLVTVELSAPLFPTATYWGGANPQSGVHHIFGGTINLNECRMVWNGTDVWRGYDELPTVKFDPTATPRLDTAEKIVGVANSIASYPMADIVGASLRDRAVNIQRVSGLLPPFAFAYEFPARTGTNARDFVLVIDELDSPPTVVFPPDVTYVSEQDAADVWNAEANKRNAWYFSEVSDGVFMVSHKALAPVAQ